MSAAGRICSSPMILTSVRTSTRTNPPSRLTRRSYCADLIEWRASGLGFGFEFALFQTHHLLLHPANVSSHHKLMLVCTCSLPRGVLSDRLDTAAASFVSSQSFVPLNACLCHPRDLEIHEESCHLHTCHSFGKCSSLIITHISAESLPSRAFYVILGPRHLGSLGVPTQPGHMLELQKFHPTHESIPAPSACLTPARPPCFHER